MAEWIGRIIDGRYLVDSVLGSGGMGVVLRTRHKFTGALVAVKMLRADLHVDAELEARFLAEARAPNAIGHAGIVQVLDAGRTPEGELYLAMELLAGQPMRLAVSRGLGAPTIRRISLELLDALSAAHARGFVHRDLKPENVFLAEPNGTVKLLDFGIAKVLAGDLGGAPRTAAGVVLGTLAYMAPEQLADARGVDARADLWAIGVMIYEMLSGRLPYRATTLEQMFVMLARDEPDSIRAYISDVSPSIEAFFTRALVRDPRARFGSAVEMAAALAQLPLVSPVSPPIVAQLGGAVTAATGLGTAPTGAVLAATSFAATIAPTRARAGESLAHRGLRARRCRRDRDRCRDHDRDARGQAESDRARGRARPGPAPVPVPAPVEPPTFAAPPPDEPATVHPATMSCKAACTALDRCHLRATNCLDDCQNSHLHGCLETIGPDCDRFAACYLKPVCGAVGNGHASCAATYACQTSRCKFGDTTCGCACVANAAFANLSEILSVDGCLLQCGADQACIQRNCATSINRCNGQ